MNYLFNCAPILLILCLVIYGWQTFRRKNTPNPATFIIMNSVAVINGVTYMIVAKYELWPTVMAILPAIGATVITVIGFRNNRLAPLGKREKKTLLFAGVAIVVWLVYGAGPANILIQCILLVGIYPAWVGILEKKTIEKPEAWLCAFLAYVIMMIRVYPEINLSSLTQSFFISSYPVSRLVMNGGLLVCIYIAKRRQ